MSGIKKFFKGNPKKDESKVSSKPQGFKKEQGINVNQFIVDATNVPPEIKSAYLSHVQSSFKEVGITKKYLKQPEFRKEVEELLQTHAKEQEDRSNPAPNEEEKRHNSVCVPASTKGNVPPPPPPPPIGFKPSNKKKTEPEKEEESEPSKKSVPNPSAAPPPPPPVGGIGGRMPPPPPKVEINKLHQESTHLSKKYVSEFTKCTLFIKFIQLPLDYPLPQP
jgi:hypothetical protein